MLFICLYVVYFPLDNPNISSAIEIFDRTLVALINTRLSDRIVHAHERHRLSEWASETTKQDRMLNGEDRTKDDGMWAAIHHIYPGVSNLLLYGTFNELSENKQVPESKCTKCRNYYRPIFVRRHLIINHNVMNYFWLLVILFHAANICYTYFSYKEHRSHQPNNYPSIRKYNYLPTQSMKVSTIYCIIL